MRRLALAIAKNRINPALQNFGGILILANVNFACIISPIPTFSLAQRARSTTHNSAHAARQITLQLAN